MSDDQEYISRMAKSVFILRQKCALKDSYFVHTLDVTSAEYSCLVQFFDTSILGVKDLSSRLYITPGAVTRVITSLEAKGIIKRRISAEDRRNIDVILTKKGGKMVEKIRHASYELHADIISHIEPEHREAVLDALEHLIGAIDHWVELHETKTGVM